MAYTFAVETSSHAPLTRISFRRDVRFFLTGLVGFLVLLIFLLLLLLRANLSATEASLHRSQQMIADVAAESVNRTSPGVPDLEAELLFLRARFGIAGMEITRRDGHRVISGAKRGAFDEVTRLVGPGTLLLRFDSAQRREARRDFLLTAAICIAAASLGASLLLSYLPRITRPIEAMLDHARELAAPGDQEETAYLIDTFRNSIATLKAQERELKELHDREKTRADDLERVTASLTRSLTSGLIAVDAGGMIVEMNAAGREILRIDAQNVVNGRRLEEIIPLPQFRQALLNSFRDQKALSRVEIEDLHREGDAVSIGLTTVPLHNEFETFLGFLALFTDLTPIRNLESRVQDMTTLAQLGEISAGIAHEFRSSLSTILGYTRLARKGGVGEIAEGRLASAEREASLLLQAIERLLAFARPVQLHTEPTDLRELVAEQVRQLHEMAPDVPVTLSGPPAMIDADRVLLNRAVENLLRNAVDSVRQRAEQGRVEVTIAASPVPTLTIADQGVGFDPADTARLFLPFQSNKPNGFGMGLALAKKIVLVHGGTIRLQGRPGEGAVAVVEFAAVAQPATPS